MRKRWLGGLALVALCTMAVPSWAAEISGVVEFGAELLPALGVDAEVDVELSGEAWSVLSEADIPLVPGTSVDELLTMSLDLDAVRLEAEIGMSFPPFEMGSIDVAAAVGVLDATILEDDPAASLSSDLAIGAVFDGAFGPYAGLETLLVVDSHWLWNETTLTLDPLDVASNALAYLTTDSISCVDGRLTITGYAYVSASVVPLGFSYAQLNALVSVDEGSLLNTVTYLGGDSFTAKATLTLDLDDIDVAFWGSFTSSATDPFGFGVVVSFSWGPLP